MRRHRFDLRARLLRRRPLPLLLLPATLATLSLTPLAPAATWTNPAGGSWSTGSNWDTGFPPNGSADFNLGATSPDFPSYAGYTVQLPPAGVPSSLHTFLKVHSDKVTLQQPAGTTSTFFVGVASYPAAGGGSLTLSGGTFSLQTFTDPDSPTTATLTISPATTATYPATLSTGFWPGSTTTFNVNGPGASLIPSGLDLAHGPGTANLNVTGGGATYGSGSSLTNPVYFLGPARLGSGGTANLTVSGQGSLLAYGNVSVATAPASTPSTVSLSAGGHILANDFRLAESGGAATLTADGAGTLLSVTQFLYLGETRSGTSPDTPTVGTASFTNGAAIAAPNAQVYIGNLGGTGSLSLATASSLSAQFLYLGSYASNSSGSLSASSGSSLHTQFVQVGQSYASAPTPSTSYGTATVTIGSATPAAPSTWTNTSDFGLYTGSLTIAAGGAVNTPSFHLHQLGTLSLAGGSLTSSSAIRLFGGTLAGYGTLHAPSLSALATGATISPDGTLALDANLDLSTNSPTLAFDLTSPTAYDRLTSIKTLTPGGTLAVSLAPSYTPQLGDSFDLLDFTSRTPGTTFSALSLPPLPPNLSWDTSALYTTGTLSISLPEPSPLLPIAFGLALLPLCRRNRRKSHPFYG